MFNNFGSPEMSSFEISLSGTTADGCTIYWMFHQCGLNGLNVFRVKGDVVLRPKSNAILLLFEGCRAGIRFLMFQGLIFLRKVLGIQFSITLARLRKGNAGSRGDGLLIIS